MKKLIVSLFLLTPMFIFAQADNQLELISIILKNDNSADIGAFFDAGNDVNACYERKETAYNLLVLSIKFDSPKVFAEALKSGADVDQICFDKTPLMYAIKYEKMDYFKQLLKAGADVSVKSKKGRTAADYAKKYEQKEMLSLLE